MVILGLRDIFKTHLGLVGLVDMFLKVQDTSKTHIIGINHKILKKSQKSKLSVPFETPQRNSTSRLIDPISVANPAKFGI